MMQTPLKESYLSRWSEQTPGSIFFALTLLSHSLAQTVYSLRRLQSAISPCDSLAHAPGYSLLLYLFTFSNSPSPFNLARFHYLLQARCPLLKSCFCNVFGDS